MDVLHEISKTYAGVPVSSEQLWSAFEDLGSFVHTTLGEVVKLRSNFVFTAKTLPDDRQVRVARHDCSSDPGSPFGDLVIEAYSIGGDLYLLTIIESSGAKHHEQDVANALGVQRALASVHVDMKLPVYNGRYHCHMEPVIQVLRAAGFTATSPELPAMTGEAAIRGLRGTMPLLLSDDTETRVQAIARQQELVSGWMPAWTFATDALQVSVTLHGGRAPAVIRPGLARTPYNDEDGRMAGLLATEPDGVVVLPRLIVEIERRNPVTDSPYPLVLSNEQLQQQAFQLASTFARLDMS